mgnify:CR=1 FL=1
MADTEKKEQVSEQDLKVLELAGMKKALAQSQYETAAAKYENVLLQVSAKYGLTAKDVVEEDGTIKRNASKE